MKSIKIIIGFAIIGVLIITSCKLPDSIGTADVNRNLKSTISLNALSPLQNFDTMYQINIKELNSDIVAKIGSRGTLIDLNFIKVNLTIADSIKYTFNDFSQFDLILGLDTLDGLPINSSGKSLVFELPNWLSNYNYKSQYEKNIPIDLKCVGKALNLIDTIKIQASYTFRIKGDVKL